MSHIQPVSLFRIGLATPCSTIVQIALCLVCFMRMKRRLGLNFSEEISA